MNKVEIVINRALQLLHQNFGLVISEKTRLDDQYCICGCSNMVYSKKDVKASLLTVGPEDNCNYNGTIHWEAKCQNCGKCTRIYKTYYYNANKGWTIVSGDFLKDKNKMFNKQRIFPKNHFY